MYELDNNIIKKFELIKTDAYFGTAFVNDAKIYKTKIFDGLDVTIMDCDISGEVYNVRDKNLLTILVYTKINDRLQCNHFLVSAEILKHCSIDIITRVIKNNIKII